jgi:hypothetical protein
MVRPSTRSTTSESSVIRTSRARASPTSLGAAEVFIPFPQKELLVRKHHSLHFSKLRRCKPSASGQPDWIQPELGAIGIALDMDVDRLIAVGRVEEEPVRPIAMDGRHPISVPPFAPS